MTSTLKTLGTALVTAGLMASAQAAPVALSAVIDFDGQTPGFDPDATVARSPSQSATPGATVTTQYEGFGLVFTDNNEVRCSKGTRANCTAPRAIPPPPHAASSPNFLMNKVGGTGFSINVLDGFSLSKLTLDLATNRTSFYIKFFDASDDQLIGRGLSFPTGTDSQWRTETLVGVNQAVRRLEFGGSDSTSFAIDFLRFDYVVDRTNVPEPGVLGLVALALAGVALSRRRKA